MEEKSGFAPRLTGFSAAAGRGPRAPLDLNSLLVRNPPSTFFARMSGDSMEGAGIRDGDLLVIDRALPLKDGDIAVVFVDGEFVARRFRRVAGGARLESEGALRKSFSFSGEDCIDLFGVVTAIVRRFPQR